MSAGEKAARTAVLLAAALLPRAMREQYREQWLADLRDAGEVGLRPSGIALGALTFAATLDRPPLIAPVVITTEVIARRSRRAGFHALTSAVLVLAFFTGAFPAGLTGHTLVDFLRFYLVGLSSLYMVIAPLMATVTVWRTPGIHRKVRQGVSLVPTAGIGLVASLNVLRVGSLFPGNFALMALLAGYSAAVIFAAVLIVRGLRPLDYRSSELSPLRSRVVPGLTAALSVWVAVALGVVNGLVLMPLDNSDGYSVAEVIAALPAEVQLPGSVWFPGPVWTTMASWDIIVALVSGWAVVAGIAGLVLGVVALLPWFTARRTLRASLFVLSVVVYSHGLVTSFASWAAISIGPDIAVSGATHAVPLALGIAGAITVVHLAFRPATHATVASSGPKVSSGSVPDDSSRPLGAVEKASG